MDPHSSNPCYPRINCDLYKKIISQNFKKSAPLRANYVEGAIQMLLYSFRPGAIIIHISLWDRQIK